MTVTEEAKVVQLVERCAELEQNVLELTAKLQWYDEQYRLAMHNRYCSSSEATSEQLLMLFNEAEAEADAADAEEAKDADATETITYKRRKFEGQREAKFKNLQVVTFPFELSAEDQICPACDGALHQMSSEVRVELRIEPAKVYVANLERAVYACRACQENETQTPVITAPMPKPAFPGSYASASAVSYIMGQKFVEGLPLYRQEKALARLGVDVSRQTLANWMLKGADWLEIIYYRLHELLVLREILHADETTLQVLHEEGRTAQKKSYLWLYRTGREGQHIILFEYQQTREGEHPRRFLLGFRGYLHVDCYTGYDGLVKSTELLDGIKLPPDVILSGCMAHARRRFDEALKALAAVARKSATMPAAAYGLKFCNDLFKIERDLHDATPEERLAGRKEKSAKVVEEFDKWLHGPQASKIMPKSATGKAIAYCINNWSKLTEFLNDGRLEIDNNRAERSIKAFVLGRRAWLFANTPRGAKSSAIIYSIVETAKENGLNPYAYIEHLLLQLPNIDTKDVAAIDNLLPWSQALPLACQTPTKTT